MTRILFFGTHPKQFNGYSKVVFELCKAFSTRPDYDLTIYGFQNFHTNPKHRPDIPENVHIYDAFANEMPKNIGFGITEIKEYVRMNKPDVCIIYNDMLVVSQVVSQLKQIEDPTFKIVAYIDQVYLNQKREFIDFINKNVDVAMLFTKFWEDSIKEQGITIPTTFLPHGFNPQAHYPIDKRIARQYFGVPQSDFVILNLNRNQPRKRWDICLKAFAEVVSRNPTSDIKLMIATATQGAWNLLEIYERELKKRNVTMEVGMKHIILMENPQKVTDEETNILYNVADIGINTCDGEGFGLCNFEQGGIGIPQICPKLGGFVDYFDDENSIPIDPRLAYYVDNTRDTVCGEALICDYMDFVDAIESYYENREMLKTHGERCRAKILEEYSWGKIADKLCGVVDDLKPKPVPIVNENADLIAEIESIDINSLNMLMASSSNVSVVMKDDEEEKIEEKVSEVEVKKEGKKKKPGVKEIKAMQQQLAALMEAFAEDEDEDDD